MKTVWVLQTYFKTIPIFTLLDYLLRLSILTLTTILYTYVRLFIYFVLHSRLSHYGNTHSLTLHSSIFKRCSV